jgi:chromate reductase, NAD(P)H dehydrogenase (quinone)
MTEDSTLQILAFAGSTRSDSYNKRLVRIAAEGAKKAGVDATFIDLRDFPLPLYDEDLEEKEGVPDNAKKLKALFYKCHGLLIASPEYNSSISAVLKNAIDWISRPVEGETDSLGCIRGKVASVMSTSPGALGGLRGLVHVRSILGNIGVIVLPVQVAVPKAHEAFNADGTLKDPKRQSEIESLGANVADMVKKLYGASLSR